LLLRADLHAQKEEGKKSLQTLTVKCNCNCCCYRTSAAGAAHMRKKYSSRLPGHFILRPPGPALARAKAMLAASVQSDRPRAPPLEPCEPPGRCMLTRVKPQLLCAAAAAVAPETADHCTTLSCWLCCCLRQSSCCSLCYSLMIPWMYASLSIDQTRLR
jgi:hypothetical protein